MAVDFDYFLRAKYAQLQQQADATTKNAATNAMVGKAAAGLDTTRAALLPGESQASIAKMGAETNLIGEQASIVRPESAARIAGMSADTDLTRTQRDVIIRQDLTSGADNFGPGIGGFLRQLNGGAGTGSQPIFRTSAITPSLAGREKERIRRGMGANPSGADLDYANGL